MNAQEEIKHTLATPGAKMILRALRSQYKFQWRKLRTCRPEEVADIQAAMNAIDALPVIIEMLANKHLDAKKDRDPSLWLRFSEWAKRFRHSTR